MIQRARGLHVGLVAAPWSVSPAVRARAEAGLTAIIAPTTRWVLLTFATVLEISAPRHCNTHTHTPLTSLLRTQVNSASYPQWAGLTAVVTPTTRWVLLTFAAVLEISAPRHCNTNTHATH